MTSQAMTFQKIAFVVVGDHNADQYLRGVVRFAVNRPDWLIHSFQWLPCGQNPEIEAWQPDGILCCVGSPDQVSPVDLAGFFQVPVVQLGPFSSGTGTWVCADPETLASLAFEHLHNAGFDNLAHVALHDSPWANDVRREFVRRCEHAHVPVAAWNFTDGVQPVRVSDVALELRERLNSLSEPTGLLCLPDSVAHVLLQTCRVLDIRVPDNVGIIGVGCSPLSVTTIPPLSSVCIPAGRIGLESARLLADILQGSPSKSRQVPCTEVAERESSRVVSSDIRTAVAFIREHAGPGLTVADVVRATQDVSRVTFEKRFKAAMNRTPGAEIRRVRIEQAKALLRETDLTITEVALRAGWSSSARFASVFRRETGMTPTDFRVSVV